MKRLARVRTALGRVPVVVSDWALVARLMVRALLDRTAPDALVDGELTPVVLLPGIWEPWRFMLPLGRRLHALGHPVHFLPALGWNGRSLEDSVQLALDELTAAADGGAVLVAHSKGGLIGKSILLDASLSRQVHGLVALCSPFGGSRLSWPVFARTPLGMFAPSGAVIVALAALQAANFRIVSIGSAWDEMVPDGTHLPGATNVTLDISGHFRPVDDPDVAHLVHEHVEQLAAAAPSQRS